MGFDYQEVFVMDCLWKMGWDLGSSLSVFWLGMGCCFYGKVNIGRGTYQSIGASWVDLAQNEIFSLLKKGFG